MIENKCIVTTRSYLSDITQLVSVLSVFALACQLIQDEDRGEVLKPYAIASVIAGMLLNVFSVIRAASEKRIFLSKAKLQDYYSYKFVQYYRNKGKNDSFCAIVCWSACLFLTLGLPIGALAGGEFGFFITLSIFTAVLTLSQGVLYVDKIRDNCLVPADQPRKPDEMQFDQYGAETSFLERENWALLFTELQFALMALAILDSVSLNNMIVPIAFLVFSLAKQAIAACSFLSKSLRISEILKPEYEKANIIFRLNKLARILHFVSGVFLLQGFMTILPRTKTVIEQIGHTAVGVGCLGIIVTAIAEFYIDQYMKEANQKGGVLTLLPIPRSARQPGGYGATASIASVGAGKGLSEEGGLELLAASNPHI